ncbi:MAG: SDR family NAD(P)-dependent oxidoreductase [Melioribacteraceae bacterium]|nr:SDR family NAD(P)-dependent oxidoreductase [Melioribacteraceae bacterium]
MEFENKVVLITGASSGIGRAIAKDLSKKEVKLALIARREDLLNEISPGNKNILRIKCDVSNKIQVSEAYSKIIEKFGKIDIAILNAGYSVRMTAEDFDSGLAEKIYGANVFGIIYWVEQLLPAFIERKEGMIAGVSSLADTKGYSKSGFYSSSKAAVTIYLEGLSSELRKYNIKVINVRPGFVRTPMTDKNEFEMPLLMEPEKAARIILNGMRKEKRKIQFPWQLVLLTNLLRFVPNSLFEILEQKRLKKYED